MTTVALRRRLTSSGSAVQPRSTSKGCTQQQCDFVVVVRGGASLPIGRGSATHTRMQACSTPTPQQALTLNVPRSLPSAAAGSGASAAPPSLSCTSLRWQQFSKSSSDREAVPSRTSCREEAAATAACSVGEVGAPQQQERYVSAGKLQDARALTRRRLQPAALKWARAGLASSTWRSRAQPDTLTWRSAPASGNSRRDSAVQPVRSSRVHLDSEGASASSPAQGEASLACMLKGEAVGGAELFQEALPAAAAGRTARTFRVQQAAAEEVGFQQLRAVQLAGREAEAAAAGGPQLAQAPADKQAGGWATQSAGLGFGVQS